MKWAKPNFGDVRVVKKFASFPTKIIDENVYVWFESYYIKQEFIEKPLWSIVIEQYNDYQFWDTIKMSTKEIKL